MAYKLKMRAEDVEPSDVVITSCGKRYTVKTFWEEDGVVTLFGTDGSETEYDYDDMDDINGDEIRELARIALASMDAKPVYQYRERTYSEWQECSERYYRVAKEMNAGLTRVLYTTPPAPVVPDEIEPGSNNTYDYVDGWNACRAAMLKGDAK